MQSIMQGNVCRSLFITMKEPSCPVHIYIELDTTLHDEYAIVAYCNTVLPYEDLSQLWPVVVVCGFCGQWSSFGVAVCCTHLGCHCWVVMVFCWVVVVVLGWLGSCRRVGFMSHYMGAMWWRSRHGLSLGGVSRLWEASLAWWLLVEEDTSQECDFGINFNRHVKSTNESFRQETVEDNKAS